MTIVLDGSAGITTPATSSGNIQTTSINNGPLAGFRNAIINGNFDIWQRGTSFSSYAYGADRWINAFAGTAATQSRQAFALGQTDVPNNPEYFCRTVVSSVAGANNLAVMETRIEDVRTFAGQSVTLSFYAKADAVKNIAVEFEQNFGAGGSPSVAVFGIGVTKVSLGTTWQKVTVTATLPSISGKTLGSSNNSYLRLLFWFDAGSTWSPRTDNLGQQSGTFDIAQVQLEAGPVATPFERRPIGTELALCQRYFYKTYNIGDAPGSITDVGTLGHVLDGTQSYAGFSAVRFPVAMRAAPAITLYNPVTGSTTNPIRNFNAATNHPGSSVRTGEGGTWIYVTGSSISLSYSIGVHYTAEAEL